MLNSLVYNVFIIRNGLLVGMETSVFVFVVGCGKNELLSLLGEHRHNLNHTVWLIKINAQKINSHAIYLDDKALPGLEPGFWEFGIRIPSDNHYTIAPCVVSPLVPIQRFNRKVALLKQYSVV